MKYQEIMERLRLIFPGTGDGMIKSLWNKYSRLFQHETHYGILSKKTINANLFSGNSLEVDVISLDAVTEIINGVDVSFGFVRATLADTITTRISSPNVLVYIFDNGKLYLYKSGSSGYLSPYIPDGIVGIYGKIINDTNMISATTTSTSDLDDGLGLSVLYALCADLYRLNPEAIKLAEYYHGLWRQALRDYKKISWSSKTSNIILSPKESLINESN
jgi:hypothetical protein